MMDLRSREELNVFPEKHARKILSTPLMVSRSLAKPVYKNGIGSLLRYSMEETCREKEGGRRHQGDGRIVEMTTTDLNSK